MSAKLFDLALEQKKIKQNKNLKRVTLILIYILFTSTLVSQNFIIDERSTESFSNYHDQIYFIERALRQKKLNGRINFTGDKVNSIEFQKLCNKFNKNINGFYSDLKSGIPTIDTKKINDSKHYIKWTYINLDSQNTIQIYLQLIVYFHIDNNEDGIYFPKVKSFEIIDGNEVRESNYKSIIYRHNQKSKLGNNQPPSPQKLN